MHAQSEHGKVVIHAHPAKMDVQNVLMEVLVKYVAQDFIGMPINACLFVQMEHIQIVAQDNVKYVMNLAAHALALAMMIAMFARIIIIEMVLYVYLQEIVELELILT